MNIDKHLLSVRLAILMGKESFTFFTEISKYQLKLKEYFNTTYTLDEIENGLHEIEEAYVDDLYKKENQIVEIEEDF